MTVSTRRVTATVAAYVEIAATANRVTILPEGSGAYRYVVAETTPAADDGNYIAVMTGGRTVLDGLSGGERVYVRAETADVTFGAIVAT